MNYSQVGIVNMALMRIGARGMIASMSEDSPNAIKVNAIWDMIFQEVLSERDWKFAKLRVVLQQSTLCPAYAYRAAYALPSDFLRLVRPRERPEERRIANFNTFDGYGGFHRHRDIPVWPPEVAPYVVETVASTDPTPVYNKFLLSNYEACACPVQITYIRLISDYTQLMPGFVNCLANRIAAELAVSITEDKQKYQGMMEVYFTTLNGAQAQLECDDFLQDESGSRSWVSAGRYWGIR